MTWQTASFIALAVWGSYSIFGNEATKVHGERLTMLIEAIAVMAVALVAISTTGVASEFSKSSAKSLVFASIMGLMSAGGIYLQFYAFRVAPNQISLIAMITGMWPVVTVVIIGIAGQLGFHLGDKLLPRQWLGVAFAAAGLALVNWGK